MKTFCSLKTYLFLGLALLFICGCDSIQKTILTDVPTAEDSAPLRVTVLYPSDCLGDDSYCDGIQSGAKRAEAETRHSAHRSARNGQRCFVVRGAVT